MEGISILICCYNSAKRLPETLKRLSKQNVPDWIPWEVILVNNNSSDNTVELASGEWDRAKIRVPFTIVNEPKQGLSFAREKGIKTAQYEYIVFCDDDNWLQPDYLKIAYEILSSNNEIGVLGGQGLLESEITPPSWFLENLKDYAVGKQAEFSGDISERGFVWGAGMVIRKSIYNRCRKLGCKTFLTGRKGNELLAGDDTEYCKWNLLLGYKLWYDERLIYTHYIPKDRISVEYFNSMWDGFRKAAYWHDKYNTLIIVRNQNNSYIKNIYIGIKLLLKKNNRSKTYKQFFIGPLVKISSADDYTFIRTFCRVLYSR